MENQQPQSNQNPNQANGLNNNLETTAVNSNPIAFPPNPVTPQPILQQPSPIFNQSTYDNGTNQQLQSSTSLGMFGRRMGRLSFLLGGIYMLLPLIIVAALQIIAHFVLSSSTNSSTALSTTTNSNNTFLYLINVISIIIGIASVIMIVPVSISLYVRRFHDLNQSGLLTLLTLIPIAGYFVFPYLLFAPGKPAPNKYGSTVNSKSFWIVLGIKRPVMS
jgi:uncharacterized membrane protein YhaH (DUF805 family)